MVQFKNQKKQQVESIRQSIRLSDRLCSSIPVLDDTLKSLKHLLRYVLGGRCFLPQAPRTYPIPMAHRVTPGQTEVTPGTKSYWHTGTTPSLVWQTKYLKCVRAIANRIFNTISFGNTTMSKVSNRHWHTRIDSKTAAFYKWEKEPILQHALW